MIEVRDLRVDADGGPCVDGLSFQSDADRTLVLGAPRELMLACAGVLPALRGEIVIEGESPRKALALGRIAACPLDAPLPLSWSPLRYLEWSARLAGVPQKERREVAEAALAHVGMSIPLTKAPLKRHSRALRRATQLASALIPAGATLVLWDPLQDLAPEDVNVFAPSLVRALGAVRSIVFATRAPLDGVLANVMQQVVVLSGSEVESAGPLREVATGDKTFRVRVAGDKARFSAALVARGAQVASTATSDELAIELGSMENAEVFRAALEAEAVVLEMRPFAAAFS